MSIYSDEDDESHHIFNISKVSFPGRTQGKLSTVESEYSSSENNPYSSKTTEVKNDEFYDSNNSSKVLFQNISMSKYEYMCQPATPSDFSFEKIKSFILERWLIFIIDKSEALMLRNSSKYAKNNGWDTEKLKAEVRLKGVQFIPLYGNDTEAKNTHGWKFIWKWVDQAIQLSSQIMNPSHHFIKESLLEMVLEIPELLNLASPSVDVFFDSHFDCYLENACTRVIRNDKTVTSWQHPKENSFINEIVNRLAHILPKMMENQQRLNKGDELLKPYLNLSTERLNKNIKSPFDNRSSVDGPAPDDFEVDQMDLTHEQIRNKSTMKIINKSLNDKSNDMNDDDDESENDSMEQSEKEKAWGKYKEMYGVNKIHIEIAVGQYDYACMFGFLPFCRIIKIFPGDIRIIAALKVRHLIESKYWNDLLGNEKTYKSELARIVHYPEEYPISQIKKTILLIEPENLTQANLKPNYQTMMDSRLEKLEQKYNIGSFKASCFLEGVKWIYVKLWVMLTEESYYDYLLKNQMSQSDFVTPPHVKIASVQCVIHSKPGDNRTHENTLISFLRLLQGRIPEKISPYLRARFGNWNKMLAEMNRMTSIQRIKCLSTFVGVGEPMAKLLAEYLCPSYESLVEDPKVINVRKELIKQMPKKKCHKTDLAKFKKEFYPLGNPLDDDTICLPEYLTPPKASFQNIINEEAEEEDEFIETQKKMKSDRKRLKQQVKKTEVLYKKTKVPTHDPFNFSTLMTDNDENIPEPDDDPDEDETKSNQKTKKSTDNHKINFMRKNISSSLTKSVYNLEEKQKYKEKLSLLKNMEPQFDTSNLSIDLSDKLNQNIVYPRSMYGKTTNKPNRSF